MVSADGVLNKKLQTNQCILFKMRFYCTKYGINHNLKTMKQTKKQFYFQIRTNN